jgi:predicted nucleotidyltransferase
MRLKNSELNAILKIFRNHTEKSNAYQVRLFGSRVDDTKRGGDIDLLVIAEEPLKTDFLNNKGLLKSDLSSALEDQRVDVTIANQEDLRSDPFLQSIMNLPNVILR